ncbi:unnamed protein product [Sphacelaria rigidula]
MSFPYHCQVVVAYPSEKLATIACSTLNVDEEIQPERIKRSIRVEGSSLLASFEASEARVLRVVLSSFYDMSLVISRTFLEFDGDELCQDTTEQVAMAT